MSVDDRNDDAPQSDHPLHAVAGLLSSGVTGELARPLRELRENLAVMVETLDRYVSAADGPRPYPWNSLQLLRQELSQAYLLSRETARMAGELYDAVALRPQAPEAIDLNRQIEAALNLVRHRITAQTELFIDLGSIPPVRAIAGEMILVMAKLLICCVESTQECESAAISIKTRHERDPEVGGFVTIYMADNGRGQPDAAASAAEAIEPLMARLGGGFDGISEPDKGSVFECRIPTQSSGVIATQSEPQDPGGSEPT